MTAARTASWRAALGTAMLVAWQIGLVDLDPRVGEGAEFRTRAFVVRAGLTWRAGPR